MLLFLVYHWSRSFNVRTSEKQPVTYIQALHQHTPQPSCLRRVQHVLQLRGGWEPAEQMVKIPAASSSVSSRWRSAPRTSLTASLAALILQKRTQQEGACPRRDLHRSARARTPPLIAAASLAACQIIFNHPVSSPLLPRAWSKGLNRGKQLMSLSE